MTKEIWKPIRGYEDLYRISNYGNIRRGKKPVNLRHGTASGGVHTVTLSKGGKGRSFLVHKLVAEAFLGSVEGMFIQHIDGDQDNCRLDNLRLIPKEEGVKQRIKAAAKSNSVAVDQYLNGVFIRSFKSMREAEKVTGVQEQSISAAANGLLKTAGGYVWRVSAAKK